MAHGSFWNHVKLTGMGCGDERLIWTPTKSRALSQCKRRYILENLNPQIPPKAPPEGTQGFLLWTHTGRKAQDAGVVTHEIIKEVLKNNPLQNTAKDIIDKSMTDLAKNRYGEQIQREVRSYLDNFRKSKMYQKIQSANDRHGWKIEVDKTVAIGDGSSRRIASFRPDAIINVEGITYIVEWKTAQHKANTNTDPDDLDQLKAYTSLLLADISNMYKLEKLWPTVVYLNTGSEQPIEKTYMSKYMFKDQDYDSYINAKISDDLNQMRNLHSKFCNTTERDILTNTVPPCQSQKESPCNKCQFINKCW